MNLIGEIANYDSRTVLLYVAIIAASTLCALLSQSGLRRTVTNVGIISLRRKFRPIPYIASFLILAFFASTTSVGVDRETYGILFEDIDWGTVGNGQEIGFNVFMLIVKLFTDDPAVFCGIFAFATVAMMFKGLYDCRDDLSLGLAVFNYASQYYFQSYNLMRIYFALGILVAGVGLLKRKKYFVYFIVMIVAFSFHYSVIFAIAAYIIGLIYIKSKSLSLGMHALWTGAAVCCAFVFLIATGDMLAEIDIPFFDRYSGYLSNINLSSIGFMWLAQSIPMIAALYFFRGFKDEYNYRRLALAFFFVHILISILSYSVPVIGRALTVLSFPYLIFYPYVTEKYRKASYVECNENNDAAKGVRYERVTMKRLYYCAILLAAVYFVGMALIYFAQYIELDGLDNFRFIWENYLW